ncbi:hypothetical protein jhhlp_000489 [Lomentospora prolificans]|uniref:VOC domain-containing protein n=1 Tax=Lomentospora prolificans TaxID=41688 RepID=A0A2N3NL37_9PEZI|nr:hypothetical protein jhhlp_000489 [Lomentospora prolificans]
MPIDHTGIQVSLADYEKVVAWYEKALAPLGYVKMIDVGPAVGFGEKGGHPDWWVSSRETGNNSSHHAFSVKKRSLVSEFHKAALEAGGEDNGAPGIRSQYHPNYYAAFVKDPVGNNIEVVCHAPETCS